MLCEMTVLWRRVGENKAAAARGLRAVELGVFKAARGCEVYA